MDITILQSIMTVVSLLTFVGIVAWAYSSAQKPGFDAAARLPFEEDDDQAIGELR
jgi:cytochrome c oxidase cbb3-type subunit IV